MKINKLKDEIFDKEIDRLYTLVLSAKPNVLKEYGWEYTGKSDGCIGADFTWRKSHKDFPYCTVFVQQKGGLITGDFDDGGILKKHTMVEMLKGEIEDGIISLSTPLSSSEGLKK